MEYMEVWLTRDVHDLVNIHLSLIQNSISKSSSFFKIISPHLEAISWFSGSKVLILILCFNQTQPILNSLYDIRQINFFEAYNFKIFAAITSLVWKAQKDNITSFKYLSKKIMKSLLMMTINADKVNQ